MVKVIWTKKALGQLERSIRYIQTEQGNSYAKVVLEKVLSNTKLLENHPKMGRIEPLLKHKKTEYRFIVVWSYKIIYRVGKEKLVVSRVFHTSRDPKSLKGI